MGTPRTSARFVGRRHELTLVEDALARARAGEPGLVLVAGDAGVGKSRFVREVVHGLDGPVLAGGCLDVGGLPYAPFVEALRRLVRPLDDRALRELVGPHLAALGPLLPTGRVPVPAGAGDRGDRTRLFEAVLAVLGRLARRDGAAVLVLEDLHWADASTLDLVRFLVRNLGDEPVLVLTTYRDDDVGGSDQQLTVLTELTRWPEVTRIDLAPFTRAELAEQLAAILGAPPTPAVVDRVLRRSEGNPFYVEELAAVGSTAVGPLPRTLQGTLTARLDALGPVARELVRAAAAVGRRVEHELLAAVVTRRDLEVLDGLRETVAAGVLETEPTGSAYRFRHALLREAAAQEILAGERVRLHRRIAEVLSERPDLAAGGAAAAPLELALHWRAADDDERAVTSALAAAEVADARHAYADAVAHREAVLERWDRLAAPLLATLPPRREVLAAASRSASFAGDQGRALRHLDAAIAELGPGPSRERATLLKERSFIVWASGDTVAGLASADAAVAALDPAASVERAAVLGWRARLLALTHDARGALPLAEEAIEVAIAVGARGEEGFARNALGIAIASLGELERAELEIRRAEQLALEVDDTDGVVRAGVNLSWLLDVAGRFAEAVAVAEACWAWAAERGLAAGPASWARLNAAGSMLALGELDRAAQLVASTPVGPDDPVTLLLHRSVAATVALARGDVAAARAHADEAAPLLTTLPDPQFAVPITTSLADLDGIGGDPAAGAERVDQLVARIDRTVIGVPLGEALRVGVRLAVDAVLVARAGGGEAAAAEATLARLRGYVDDTVRDAPSAVARAQAEAVAAWADAEVSRLEPVAATEPWSRVRRVEGAALTPLRAVELDLRRGEAAAAAGRREEATAALRAARDEAVRIGAGGLADRAVAVARGARLPLDADSAVAEGGGLGLTPREREVLQLLAEGRTNREIGAALHVTEKTASVHVSNILTKLGVRSRVEAASFALRTGLVPS